MILETIINAIFLPLNGLLAFLPDISWNVNSGVFTKFMEVLRMACYFLPMGTVGAVFALVIAINVFKIVISTIKTIWQLLPFL